MPDISVWNKCNNKCIMCTNPKEYSSSTPKGNYDLKSQIKKLDMYLKGQKVFVHSSKNDNYINLTGGEPTLHPHFLVLLKYIRNKFPRTPITLLTNGRRFSDLSFTKKFCAIAKRPFTVAISFHSYNKKTFEKITAIKGSFNQTLTGIENIIKNFEGEIEIRIVIHSYNINDIEKTILFLKELFCGHKNWHITIIHYEIEGVGEKNKNKILLKLSRSVKKLIEIEKTLKQIPFRLYHFPLCILPSSLKKYAWATLGEDEIVFTKKCKECKLKKRCVGLMKRYFELYGDYELKPVK